jgi:hypothetical protein
MFPMGIRSLVRAPETLDRNTAGIVFPENIVPLLKLSGNIFCTRPDCQRKSNTHGADAGISIRTLRNKLNELKLGEQQAV